ncbi:MAG: hypothetical protein JXA52_02835 [Planctomycetes bacterium]|nr:hypothetical protein [Planctomycetota bacterium]
MNRVTRGITTVAVTGALLLSSGCTQTQKGAGIGSGIGAAAGAIIGHQSGHGVEGALIGAGTGALAGGMIGSHQDKEQLREENAALQEELRREREDAELERVRSENYRLNQELGN